MLAALVTVVLALVLGSLCVHWHRSGIPRIRRTSAAWVVRHLQREGTYVVKAGSFTNVWTPERPSSSTSLPTGFYQMPGRGSLSYSLDPDGETVRLLWRNKAGSRREWVGPVPVVASAGYRRSMRRGRVAAAIVVATIAVGGTVFGAFTSSISVGVASGLFVGFLVGSIVLSAEQMQAFRSALELRRGTAGGTDGGATAGRDPAGADPEPVTGHARSEKRRSVRAAYATYGTVLTLGFVLGFVVTSGSGVERILLGVLGLLLAAALVPVAGGMFRMAVAANSRKRSGTGKDALSSRRSSDVGMGASAPRQQNVQRESADPGLGRTTNPGVRPANHPAGCRER